jgi:flavin reductase (DIM6/NTAB) family NADH-FMN oxidoreductase RutF
MQFSQEDIKLLNKIKRLNLINSVTGIKPANLIGTFSKKNSNLAIISSVVHLSSNPPLLSFMLRPDHKVPRHTFENIKETGIFTINNITNDFIDNAHDTSAKFEREVSEFEQCNLTEEYLFNFKAPFVKESNLKLGMKYIESVFIKSSDTVMVIGQIEHIDVSDIALEETGCINLEKLASVGISGLNAYYDLSKVKDIPYARVENVPKLKK